MPLGSRAEALRGDRASIPSEHALGKTCSDARPQGQRACYAAPMKLGGRVAIVTGGGRGLGRAIALRFANEGVAVAVTGTGREHLEATAREIVALGGRSLAVV